MPTTLVLVPTDLERRAIAPSVAAAATVAAGIELCGFGTVSAAARTAGLVADRRPDRVLLVGIAGRLDERLAVGGAWRFVAVSCHGIGAGSGAGFLPAGALGWPQWPGDPASAAARIGDVIPLAAGIAAAPPAAGQLLTVCAASATAADVAERRALYPDATAEDMEGFGVALACRLAGVPLAIVRGISNDAGDRDRARWRLDAALAAAAGLAGRVLEERW